MSALDLQTLCPTAVVPEMAAPANDVRQFRNVKQARILIVDDESLNIDVVQGYLEIEGYRNIASTQNAIQALPLVGTFRPDLIATDIPHARTQWNGDSQGHPRMKIFHDSCRYFDRQLDQRRKLELWTAARQTCSQARPPRRTAARIAMSFDQSLSGSPVPLLGRLTKAPCERTADLEHLGWGDSLLARAAEFRDDDMASISSGRRYARIIGEELGLPAPRARMPRAGCPLHDVGKIGIPDAILPSPQTHSGRV